jgi:predicted DNA-binding protein (UPF0278 family)
MPMNKEYLGDAVYVEVLGDMLKLTTSNGYKDTATIYLEPEVYSALTKFVERVKDAPADNKKED